MNMSGNFGSRCTHRYFTLCFKMCSSKKACMQDVVGEGGVGGAILFFGVILLSIFSFSFLCVQTYIGSTSIWLPFYNLLTRFDDDIKDKASSLSFYNGFQKLVKN